MKKLEQRFLEAVDRAYNEFRVHLTFEGWVAAIGIATEQADRLRIHLQHKGIL